MENKNVLKTTALHNRGIKLDFVVYSSDGDYFRTKLMAKTATLSYAFDFIYADMMVSYGLMIHPSEFTKYVQSHLYGDYIEVRVSIPYKDNGFVVEHYLIRQNETSN